MRVDPWEEASAEGVLDWLWGGEVREGESAEHLSADEAVYEWLTGRERVRVSRIVRPSGETAPAAEAIGDGSPLARSATDLCWEACQRLQRSVTEASNPAVVAARRIRTETGIRADANPYFGFTRAKLEAVVRAAYHSQQPPEVLLALWMKEGSARMVTSAQSVSQATTPANARALFRSRVYYEDLGADHFLVTTRPGGTGSDNVWDARDSAAAGHETHFARQVAALVRDGVLSEDVSAAINAELTTSGSAPFSVSPSVKFYSLSLLLVDALYTRMQQRSFPQLSSISAALNYLQWNMGTATFRTFLESADRHRREPQHQVGGSPISIEQWALHTVPRANEWRGARINAVRFLHYMESYRPIFAGAMTVIRPGIEDLRVPSNLG